MRFDAFRFDSMGSVLRLGVGLVVLGVAVGSLTSDPVWAQSPTTITQQGLLTDDEDVPIHGSVNAVFSIGEGLEGGVELTYTTNRMVEVVDGRYNVRIGEEATFPNGTFFPHDTFIPGTKWEPGSLWFPHDTFLRTEVEGERLTPDQPLTSTPYAFVASSLFNETNLFMAADGNASVHVNNEGSATSGQFAVFGDRESEPWMVLAKNPDGVPELFVDGNLAASGSKPFRIPHPTKDGMVLTHHAVESSEVLNTYSGNVTLDEEGTAVVRMPEWFDPINKDPRYNLTPIGAPAPGLHVAEPMADGRFEIAGGEPGLRVSWQVTAVRDDPTIRRQRTPVVQEKEQ